MGTIKRYTLYTLLMLIAITAFYSCEAKVEDPKQSKKKTVALIVRMKHGDYWRTVKLGAEMAAKEYDLNLNFYAPDYEEDSQSQMELLRQATLDGYDALVVAPSDDQVLQETIGLAQSSVPIITLDTEGQLPQVKSYIGTDNYDMGKKACEKMVQLIGKKGHIALVGTGRSTANAVSREKGVRDVIAQDKQVELVPVDYVQLDKKLIGELTRELVRHNPGVKGIIALDASTSIGVAEEIEKMGLQEKIKIVAIDSPPEVLEYLQEGVISATIIQKPFSMGYLGVKYALEASEGKQVPERVDTGTKVIDRDNMFWSENQKLLFPFVK
ncbi:substrate-binding domain-containing protein [Brevibacillus choshinensis]|uniref:Substrate-binding domain-containing protein n=1 Tax=Brevibacillus choshinensis TaxID=54911 RepID=A0ABX7FRE5_BRECH|nr:substrate-binding domain-containing protein [Brevibacillus choshinensis]QRG68264.1 substrate-binding domain-containing protein [Brevibacillus choshinensis]